MKKSALCAVQERLFGSVAFGENATLANTHSEWRKEAEKLLRPFTIGMYLIEALFAA